MDELSSVQQSQAARRVNLAKWRAGRRHEMDLPSGLPVVVRDASITDLMLAGEVPQTLMEQITAAAENEKDVEIDLQKFAGSPDFGLMVNGIVKACLLEPAVAEKADVDHITLDELSGDDKMEIFNWANREVAPFRGAEGQADAAPQPVDVAQPG